jgi:hypothetical protein
MKQFFPLCFLLMTALVLTAQNDTVIYLGVNGKLGLSSGKNIKKEIQYKSEKKIKIETFGYNDSRWSKIRTEVLKKTAENIYRITVRTPASKQIIYRQCIPLDNGLYSFTERIENQIIRTGYSQSAIPLVLHGEITEYYPNGTKKSISQFRNNELVSNQNWQEDGQKYLDNIFYSVDVPPRFTPGMDSLHRHLLQALERNAMNYSDLSGEIEVGFVVLENGTLDGLHLIKGISSTVNRIVLSAFLSLEGEWKPARLQGKKVRYMQKFPIHFMGSRTKFEFIDFQSGVMHWD